MTADKDSFVDQTLLSLLLCTQVRPGWTRAQADGRGQLTCTKQRPPPQPWPQDSPSLWGKGRKNGTRVPGMSKGQGHVWSEELKWLSGLEKQQSTFTQSPHPHPLP